MDGALPLLIVPSSQCQGSMTHSRLACKRFWVLDKKNIKPRSWTYAILSICVHTQCLRHAREGVSFTSFVAGHCLQDCVVSDTSYCGPHAMTWCLGCAPFAKHDASSGMPFTSLYVRTSAWLNILRSSSMRVWLSFLHICVLFFATKQRSFDLWLK